jgi:hypothetical protein
MLVDVRGAFRTAVTAVAAISPAQVPLVLMTDTEFDP